MFAFFDTIINWLSLLADYIISFFKNAFALIQMSVKAMASIGIILNFFPLVITAPIFVLIAISLIVTILNKWG